MSISNDPPHVTLELTEGEADALELFLAMRKREAEERFKMAQATMMMAASDLELCIQLQMKMRGEPTGDRYRFKPNREKMNTGHSNDPGAGKKGAGNV